MVMRDISSFHYPETRFISRGAAKGNKPIVCLIIIVNIIFLGYFKYYFTYDQLFFTVRSPFHAALPDPKIILICSLFSQISMFEDFFADQILPGNLSESRRWIVICIKEYLMRSGYCKVYARSV